MANSYKHTHKVTVREFVQFSTTYSYISIILAVVLILFSYKEVIELRFMSNFLSDSAQYSATENQLLVDGFSNNMLERFFEHLPIISLVVLIILVSYSLVTAYRATFYKIKVSKFYLQAKQEPISLITMRYAAICSASFTVPLLYWCFLIGVWFPYFVKYPLKYIIRQDLSAFALTAIGIVILLSLLTHVGITLTRLAARLFQYALRG